MTARRAFQLRVLLRIFEMRRKRRSTYWTPCISRLWRIRTRWLLWSAGFCDDTVRTLADRSHEHVAAEREASGGLSS
jgi:hypothetical protein